MRTGSKTHFQWYLQGIVRPIISKTLFLTRISFITSSIFWHVCHFMHWNHEERSSKSINSCNTKSAQRILSTRMQHVCQCMKNEPSRAYYQERCHTPPETPASNKQRSNMCVNSLKMNHVWNTPEDQVRHLYVTGIIFKRILILHNINVVESCSKYKHVQIIPGPESPCNPKHGSFSHKDIKVDGHQSIHKDIDTHGYTPIIIGFMIIIWLSMILGAYNHHYSQWNQGFLDDHISRLMLLWTRQRTCRACCGMRWESPGESRIVFDIIHEWGQRQLWGREFGYIGPCDIWVCWGCM